MSGSLVLYSECSCYNTENMCKNIADTIASDIVKDVTIKPDEENLKDMLMEFTHYTKVSLYFLDDCYKKFQGSIFYKILFRTTQPAHLITMLAISTIAFFVFPGKVELGKPSRFVNFIYLGAFATHLGAQIWMTFVSGLSLYFALPRHSFGEVQKVLFPKYFFFNSLLSLITLTIYLNHHNRDLWKLEVFTQAVTMSACFLTELVIRLYMTPSLLYFMVIKIKMEKEAGVGMEIGKHDPGTLGCDPHYLRIHKSFRRVHVKIAMGNIITMACTIIHLCYLSSKLCVL